jgi:hypothetical protein
MNFVSDARLAIACNKAGIVPSLVSNDKIKEQLKEFRDSCPDGDIILSSDLMLAIDIIGTDRMMKILKDYRVSHIQLLKILKDNESSILEKIRDNGTKIIYKSQSPVDLPSDMAYIDAIDLKSPDAASRVVIDGRTTMERFLEQKAMNPDMPIIVTGGISTSEQIKIYLWAGAEAIGLGTIFALSEESRIHPDKKLEMIKKSFSDVKSIGVNRMNGIVFSETPDTDNNHTDGLRLGRDTKDQGVIWAGKALDNINAIESVQTIVDRLTKGL